MCPAEIKRVEVCYPATGKERFFAHNLSCCSEALTCTDKNFIIDFNSNCNLLQHKICFLFDVLQQVLIKSNVGFCRQE